MSSKVYELRIDRILNRLTKLFVNAQRAIIIRNNELVCQLDEYTRIGYCIETNTLIKDYNNLHNSRSDEFLLLDILSLYNYHLSELIISFAVTKDSYSNGIAVPASFKISYKENLTAEFEVDGETIIIGHGEEPIGDWPNIKLFVKKKNTGFSSFISFLSKPHLFLSSTVCKSIGLIKSILKTQSEREIKKDKHIKKPKSNN